MKEAQVFISVSLCSRPEGYWLPSVTSDVESTWHNPVAYHGLQSFCADTSWPPYLIPFFWCGTRWLSRLLRSDHHLTVSTSARPKMSPIRSFVTANMCCLISRGFVWSRRFSKMDFGCGSSGTNSVTTWTRRGTVAMCLELFSYFTT